MLPIRAGGIRSGRINCARSIKRKEHEDFWLWNHDFYNAGIDDLKYIAKLVGAKEGR